MSSKSEVKRHPKRKKQFVNFFFFFLQFFAQIFESNPAPPNSMVYIVLPPELSKRSIQILIQYMYSGEATVSNDILNEVLHGGELLKIRGLCRNKHSNSVSSINDTLSSSSSTHYLPTESTCEKTMYDHQLERLSSNTSNGNLSIIKESPVVVTSPPHIANTGTSITHKSSASASASASTTPGLCTSEQEIPKRVGFFFYPIKIYLKVIRKIFKFVQNYRIH